ncbi:hypothetical protein [Massilia sp. TN1-12]|uniref:hypothetical protein n=1 Tax=Massilia paldalensis TaxID=3377675 RepID=UPI003850DE08
MNNTMTARNDDWRFVFDLPMFLSLCTVFVGTWPLFDRASGQGTFNLGGLLHALFLVYGLFGLAVCHMEAAPHRKWFGRIGLGWTAFVLLILSMSVPSRTGDIYPFGRGGNLGFLAICIAIAGVLAVHDRHRDTMSGLQATAIRWLAHGFFAAWACLPFVSFALMPTD